MEQLISVGILIIMIGIVLAIAGGMLTAKSKKTKTEWSVVGLIGPFPFGLGSNRKMLLIGFAILAIFILLLVILKIGR